MRRVLAGHTYPFDIIDFHGRALLYSFGNVLEILKSTAVHEVVAQ